MQTWQARAEAGSTLV